MLELLGKVIGIGHADFHAGLAHAHAAPQQGLGPLHLLELQVAQRRNAQLRGETLAEGLHGHTADGGHFRQTEVGLILALPHGVHHPGDLMAQHRVGRHAVAAVRRQQRPEQLRQLEAGLIGAAVTHQHLHDLPNQQNLIGQDALPGGNQIVGVHLPQERRGQRSVHREPQKAAVPGFLQTAVRRSCGNDEAFALLEAKALGAEGHGHVALVGDQPKRMMKGRDLVLILRQNGAARLPDPDAAFFYQPCGDVGSLNKDAGVAVFGVDRNKSKLIHLAVSSLYSSGQLSDRI